MSTEDERLSRPPTGSYVLGGGLAPSQDGTLAGALRKDPLIGAMLGAYRVIEPVGGGGMGMVYKAWQETMQRTVAIKVLKPQLMADPGVLQRFQREAVSASRLNHPN